MLRAQVLALYRQCLRCLRGALAVAIVVAIVMAQLWVLTLSLRCGQTCRIRVIE
jgi:hypothetical protein